MGTHRRALRRESRWLLYHEYSTACAARAPGWWEFAVLLSTQWKLQGWDGVQGSASCPTAHPNCRVKEGANKEVLGILVSYRVKVKLVVSRGG